MKKSLVVQFIVDLTAGLISQTVLFRLVHKIDFQMHQYMYSTQLIDDKV